uniref:Uncharacterized protein n=1 Tax=Ditylenchus dipsaci TaxID=166011 RepID=A0A915D6P1_9BILA
MVRLTLSPVWQVGSQSKWMITKYSIWFLLQYIVNLCIIVLVFYALRHSTPPIGNHLVYYGTIGYSMDQEGKTLTTENQLNELRLERARRMLKIGNLSRFKVATSSHRLTIGILASGRHNHELTQLIGHLSNYLTDNFRLVICNVEYSSIARPQEVTHFEQFLEVIDINSAPTASKNFEVYSNRIAKEAQDYWKCLNQTAKWGSDYVLLLEDDALPVPEFNTAINSIMRQLDKIKQVDYVKLFHPWRLRGIPSLFQTIIVTTFLAYFLQLLIWRDRNLFVILLVTVSGHIVVRMYFREIFADVQFFITQSAQLSKAESCCTPAVIFRAFKIGEIVTELSSEKATLKHAKDHILDESKFEGRATDANFVVHIGYYSYLRKKIVRTGN